MERANTITYLKGETIQTGGEKTKTKWKRTNKKETTPQRMRENGLLTCCVSANLFTVCPFKYLLYMKRQTTWEAPPQNKTNKKDFTVQVCKIKTWTGTIPSLKKKRMWFIQDERRNFAMNNILFSCFWSSLTDFKQFSLVSMTKYVLALTMPTIFSLTSLAKNARKSHRTN